MFVRVIQNKKQRVGEMETPPVDKNDFLNRGLRNAKQSNPQRL